MRKGKSQVTALCAAVVLTAFGSDLNAQGVVDKQVMEIGLYLASEGYEMTHEIVYSSLDDGDHDFYTFELEKGMNYKIYAVCDEDCNDIDLCLYDGRDKEIECDESEDDYPIVDVTVSRAGTFSFKVTMHDCELEPCKFGIAIFGR